jgi:adenine-specific DNA methylase
MTKKKVFTSAPLPFMGQKRRFLKEFKKALEQYPDNATYVDLFGGSGLLAHTVRNHYPNATVVYNDFDSYSERLANVEHTNGLIAEIRALVGDYPKDKRIVEPLRSRILDVVYQAEINGYVDYITLSSSLLFSMKYVLSYDALYKETLYNVVKLSDYNTSGYLDGLEVVSLDYKDLFKRYKDCPNVVFLVDPPYLSTDVGTYKNYWKLKDYLDVLQVLQGTRYFYFTSNKSNIIELCEWISTITPFNPFSGATVSTTSNHVNFSSSYTDIMLYKYTPEIYYKDSDN